MTDQQASGMYTDDPRTWNEGAAKAAALEFLALRAREARDQADVDYREAVRGAVASGVSRGQLARTLGIDRAAVSRIVSGKRSG